MVAACHGHTVAFVKSYQQSQIQLEKIAEIILSLTLPAALSKCFFDGSNFGSLSMEVLEMDGWD